MSFLEFSFDERRFARSALTCVDLTSLVERRGTEMNGKPLFHSDPMGGIQVIAVGDFFQLPPVKLEGGFAFESAAWRNLNFVSCVMSRIWRQSDPTFANILNEIRLGRVSDEALRKLQECERPLPTDDGECPHCRRDHPLDSTLSPLPPRLA